MTVDNSIAEEVPSKPRKKCAEIKPAKPYPEFPLTAHPAGYWCKKIRGRLHYFGPWPDPDGALAKYMEQKDDLHAGREPKADPEELTVKEAANLFLNGKEGSSRVRRVVANDVAWVQVCL